MDREEIAYYVGFTVVAVLFGVLIAWFANYLISLVANFPVTWKNTAIIYGFMVVIQIIRGK